MIMYVKQTRRLLRNYTYFCYELVIDDAMMMTYAITLISVTK